MNNFTLPGEGTIRRTAIPTLHQLLPKHQNINLTSFAVGLCRHFLPHHRTSIPTCMNQMVLYRRLLKLDSVRDIYLYLLLSPS